MSEPDQCSPKRQCVLTAGKFVFKIVPGLQVNMKVRDSYLELDVSVEETLEKDNSTIPIEKREILNYSIEPKAQNANIISRGSEN